MQPSPAEAVSSQADGDRTSNLEPSELGKDEDTLTGGLRPVSFQNERSRPSPGNDEGLDEAPQVEIEEKDGPRICSETEATSATEVHQEVSRFSGQEVEEVLEEADVDHRVEAAAEAEDTVMMATSDTEAENLTELSRPGSSNSIPDTDDVIDGDNLDVNVKSEDLGEDQVP